MITTERAGRRSRDPRESFPARQRGRGQPRIQLPDSATWDIYRGETDERLLQAMLDIAEGTPYAVTVLASGHPRERVRHGAPQHHTAGRGIDVYAVDGTLVVEQQQDGSPAHTLARWLDSRGIPELGSPWAFDGASDRSFTDTVHADICTWRSAADPPGAQAS